MDYDASRELTSRFNFFLQAEGNTLKQAVEPDGQDENDRGRLAHCLPRLSSCKHITLIRYNFYRVGLGQWTSFSGDHFWRAYLFLRVSAQLLSLCVVNLGIDLKIFHLQAFTHACVHRRITLKLAVFAIAGMVSSRCNAIDSQN